MSYRRYALERVASAVVIFWLALTATFFLFHRELGRPPRGDVQNDPELRRYDHYFRESYWDFLSRLVGDRSLGIATYDGATVNDWVIRAAPGSLSILLFSFAFAAFAVPLGIFWGRHSPGRLTRPLRLVSAIVYGLPVFSLALLLIYWVGWKWSLLPLGGYCDLVNPSTDCGGFADWARALILPGVSFGAFFAAVHLRVVSALVRNAERARKDGDEEARKSAALSYVKLLGRDFGFALGLCVLPEMIFGIPGLGRTLILGLEAFDPALMEGTLIFATLLAMSVNLVVDLAVAAAEPRFRRF